LRLKALVSRHPPQWFAAVKWLAFGWFGLLRHAGINFESFRERVDQISDPDQAVKNAEG